MPGPSGNHLVLFSRESDYVSGNIRTLGKTKLTVSPGKNFAINEPMTSNVKLQLQVNTPLTEKTRGRG